MARYALPIRRGVSSEAVHKSASALWQGRFAIFDACGRQSRHRGAPRAQEVSIHKDSRELVGTIAAALRKTAEFEYALRSGLCASDLAIPARRFARTVPIDTKRIKVIENSFHCLCASVLTKRSPSPHRGGRSRDATCTMRRIGKRETWHLSASA